ncbi:DUF2075 domain-containing protein [bacterium]|nr:DUF2075 domain-containing protein [bacterium]
MDVKLVSMSNLNPQSGRAMWFGSVESFLDGPLSGADPGRETFRLDLRNVLRGISADLPQARRWWLAIDYELPGEPGRRIDACLLTKGAVVLIAARREDRQAQAEMESCSAIIRDMQSYHFESQTFKIQGVVLLTGRDDAVEAIGEVCVVGTDYLAELLKTLPSGYPSPRDAEAWLNSPYEPLPNLIESAALVFRERELPQIPKVSRTQIPRTLEYLEAAADEALRKSEKHLVLISGRPGSGKTLLGLQFVHGYGARADRRGVFLSGNGPLIRVLQTHLESRVFVRDVHSFIYDHAIRKVPLKTARILVFDEAQRAWDREKVRAHNREHLNIDVDQSEPRLLLNAAGGIDGGVLVVGIIGEGQQIYSGEEGGIGLWEEAVRAHGRSWTVHVPPDLRDFRHADSLRTDPCLKLLESLRSHVAEQVHDWVDRLLEGRLEAAAALAERLIAQRFYLYITRTLETAKSFLADRYASEPLKTCGILASSHARSLKPHGIDIEYLEYHSPQLITLEDVGEWYSPDPLQSERHCRAMNRIATEFFCQGLELDAALLAWGADLAWDGQAWRSASLPFKHPVQDPHRLRINSYRVLLTRARDGLIVFCPEDPDMDRTCEGLLQAGFKKI